MFDQCFVGWPSHLCVTMHAKHTHEIMLADHYSMFVYHDDHAKNKMSFNVFTERKRLKITIFQTLFKSECNTKPFCQAQLSSAH